MMIWRKKMLQEPDKKGRPRKHGKKLQTDIRMICT